MAVSLPTATVTLLLGLAALSAAAQPRQAAPAPAPAPAPALAVAPERTAATYGDWVMRCEAQAGRPTRACEAAHGVLDARGQVVAQLAILRPAAGGAAVVQVPVNALVAEPARLQGDGAALVLAFRACAPRGCFAEAPLPEPELQALRHRTEPARLEYRDAAGAAVVLPVSLRGFAAALEALEREPR